MKHMKTYLRRIVAFIKDEAGASAVEYALLVALIALVLAGGATLLGKGISGMFTNTANKIDAAAT
jgi:pilus assembly protein Flp/PilA